MAEASSEPAVPKNQTSGSAKAREKDVPALDTTVSRADLYRMCKKIAQLTKVKATVLDALFSFVNSNVHRS